MFTHCFESVHGGQRFVTGPLDWDAVLARTD